MEREIEKKIAADLSQISSKEMFAEWLWRVLCLLYRGKGDLYRLITRLDLESAVKGLGYVYERCIPDAKRLMFRQAIGRVLRSHGNSYGAPVQALKDLVYLIALTKATESLSALLPTVGKGSLGKRHPDTLYSAIACLKHLSPSTDVYEVVSALVDCENFDDGYLFEAIKTLVECKPLQASSIIERLKPRLIDLGRLARELSGDEWRAFRSAATECGISTELLKPLV